VVFIGTSKAAQFGTREIERLKFREEVASGRLVKEAITIFPNQSLVAPPEFIRIWKDELSEITSASDSGSVVYPRIDGFVRYLSAGDSKFHLTEFSFRIGQRNAAGGRISIDTALEKIDRSELYFVPDSVIGPSYTD
jgi:hypothetical protein